MRKFIVMLFIAATTAALWEVPAHAGETAYRFDPVTQKSRPLIFSNTYQGYLVFKEVCKRCHTRDNPEAPFLYSESKLEAEKLALEMNDHDFDVSVIRPRLVWGPGDQAVLPVIIKMIEESGFRIVSMKKTMII